MTHSKNFEKVMRYYREGFWNIDRVRLAVGRWITPEEYEIITGSVYEIHTK